MLSTDTILIATPLDRLISGSVTSSDVINSRKVVEKTEAIAKAVITGQPAIKKPKRYNYKTISETLELELSMDQLMERAELLMKNTQNEYGELIPKVIELSDLLRDLLPYNQTTDVLGMHLKDPSMTEKLNYLRIYGAIDEPLNVLARIAYNSFTRQELDAVKRAYPELVDGFSMMLNCHLMDLAADGKEVVGRNRSLGLKRFFGESIFRPPMPGEQQEAQMEQAKRSGSIKPQNFNAANRMPPESQKDLGE